MKKLNLMLLYFVFATLGLNLVLPFFDKSFNVVADELPQPFIYEYGVTGDNIIGSNVVKRVNYTFFRQLLSEHITIILQWRNIGETEWNDGNQYMTINKDWNDTLEGWKINFIFSKPYTQNNIDARFIFNCDLPVLNYIVREDRYTYFLNYTVPNTNETYHVYFNWSDLMQYDGLQLDKQIIDNQFYFTITRYDIPNTFVGDIVLDPVLGYDTEGSTWIEISRYVTIPTLTASEWVRGTNHTFSGDDGELNNVSAFLREDAAGTLDAKAGVYWESNSTVFAECQSPVTVDGDTGAWYKFDFNEELLKDGVSYIFTVYANAGTTHQDYVYVAYDASGGENWEMFYDKEDNYPTFPDPASFISFNNFNLSIYANYSVGAEWNLIATHTADFGNDTLPGNLIATHTADFGNDTLLGNLIATHTADFGNDTLPSNLIATHTADFGNDTLLGNLIATHTADFGNDTLPSNLIATHTSDFGNDTLSGNLVATHSADFGNDTLESNLIATHTADFGNDTLPSNLIATHTADFGNDTLSAIYVGPHGFVGHLADFGNDSLSSNLVATHTADFGNDTPTVIWNLIATHTADFGNDTLWGNLVATHSADFGNDSLSANLVATHTADFGNDTETVFWNLIATHTADFGNDTETIFWNLIATHTADFGNDTGWYLIATHTADFGNDTGSITLTDIYKIVNWINNTLFEGDGIMDIGLTGSLLGIGITLILFILFFVIGYRENKRSGGAFMLLSGFMLISLEIITASYLDSLYLLPLLTPVSIFIMILGVRKWLYPVENEYTKSEGQ